MTLRYCLLRFKELPAQLAQVLSLDLVSTNVAGSASAA